MKTLTPFRLLFLCLSLLFVSCNSDDDSSNPVASISFKLDGEERYYNADESHSQMEAYTSVQQTIKGLKGDFHTFEHEIYIDMFFQSTHPLDYIGQYIPHEDENAGPQEAQIYCQLKTLKQNGNGDSYYEFLNSTDLTFKITNIDNERITATFSGTVKRVHAGNTDFLPITDGEINNVLIYDYQ